MVISRYFAAMSRAVVALLVVALVALPQVHANPKVQEAPDVSETSAGLTERAEIESGLAPAAPTDCCGNPIAPVTEGKTCSDGSANECPMPCEPDEDCPCECPCCGTMLHTVPMMSPMSVSVPVLLDSPRLFLLAPATEPDGLALGVAIQPPIV